MSDKKQTNYLDQDKLSSSEHTVTNDAETASVMPWVIQFRVVGTPSVIQIPTREKTVIGRTDPDRKIKADIDMSRFNGQKKGVSRRHAQLIARDNRITITDLKSANGTYINDLHLTPNQPYRLRDGDRLRLGDLDLQVNFIVRPYVSDETMVGLGNQLNIPKIGNQETILVVDTDEATCDVVGSIITHANFQVAKAYTTEQAISIIDSAEPPQALFLELLLQDAQGADLVRYYRQKVGADNPVVAMATATAGYHMDQAFQSGVDIFIPKPVAIEQLNNTLFKIADILAKS